MNTVAALTLRSALRAGRRSLRGALTAPRMVNHQTVRQMACSAGPSSSSTKHKVDTSASKASVQEDHSDAQASSIHMVTRHASGKDIKSHHQHQNPLAMDLDDHDDDDHDHDHEGGGVEGEEEEEEMLMPGPSLGMKEWGGPTRGGKRLEPTRYGDWDRMGRVSDF